MGRDALSCGGLSCAVGRGQEPQAPVEQATGTSDDRALTPLPSPGVPTTVSGRIGLLVSRDVSDPEQLPERVDRAANVKGGIEQQVEHESVANGSEQGGE